MNISNRNATLKLASFVATCVVLFSITLFAQGVGRGVPSAEDQMAAVGCLRSINTAETYYAKQYEKGFSETLKQLGVPAAGTKESAEAAGLLDDSLTGGKKNNFVFTYQAGLRMATGGITGYTVTARPAKWEPGVKSYFTDQTAVIRWTDQKRAPNASDPTL
jgi:hypothetical protein